MRIIICGSISAADEILRVKSELEGMGHQVEIPEGVKREQLRAKPNSSQYERADIKIKHNLIQGYYEKIKLSDAVLVVNPEKNGVKGYIGGNTFLEMGFAHVLGKKLYCLYDLPQMLYSSEILAMQSIVLNGDLNLFAKLDKS